MRFASYFGFGLALVAILGLTTAPVCAQGKKSDSVVKVKASASKPDADGKQVVTITLTMEKGWHTYANPVGHDDLAEAATTVAILVDGKKIDAKVNYPNGVIIKDKVIGNYKVYEDTVTIKAVVTRDKDSKEPVEAEIKLQSCNDSKCLLPATVKIKATE